MFLDTATDIAAIHVGQHAVEQYNIRALLPKPLERSLAADRFVNSVAGLRQDMAIQSKKA